MKKIFSILAVLIMTVGFFSTDVQAAKSNDSRDMKLFREMMDKPTKELDIFHQELIFLMPMVQVELDFLNQTDPENHNLKVEGDFGVWYINQLGEFSEFEVPFYVNQNKTDMDIYYKLGETWKKFSTPTIASMITDDITTPTDENIDEFMDMAKDVKILQESEKRRTFLVHLDGKKIADWLATGNKENPADKGTAGDEQFQEQLLKYIQDGFRTADSWYTITVDAKDNHTMNVSFNLSGVVQAAALSALNDKDKNWNEFERDLLESVAFYSDFKAYTTFLNPELGKKIEIPDEVLNSAQSATLIPDNITQ